MKTYKELQKHFKVKVGDSVKIVRKPTSSEISKWGISWNDNGMDQTIGLSGVVTNIQCDHIYVKVPGHNGPGYQNYCWIYPYFALSIVR